MMRDRIFTPATMEANNPAGAMTAEMRPIFLAFTLRWVPGRPVILHTLWARGNGDWEWRSLVADPVRDDNGEITVALGWFSPGEVQVQFGAFMLEDVERAAAFIIEGGRVIPLLPVQGATVKYVAIGRKETWDDEATHNAGQLI